MTAESAGPARRATRGQLVAAGSAALLALAGCGNGAEPPKGSSTASSTATPSESESVDATTYPTQKKKACQVLSVSVAKSILGDVGPASAPPPAATSKDVRVTSCVRANTLAGLDKARSVSLLMRVATDSDGARSNASVFSVGSRPDAAQTVEGYGEQAFWNPAFGQLNILAHGNWYILSVGPVDPKKHSLAETEKLADAIKDQL